MQRLGGRMAERNPFTPSFGIVPDFLAGREAILKEMSRAFENGLGDPNLASVIVGSRGSGKTALLACIGDEARKAGWLVVDSVAAPGMLEDILRAEEQATPQRTKPGADLGHRVGARRPWTSELADPHERLARPIAR